MTDQGRSYFSVDFLLAFGSFLTLTIFLYDFQTRSQAKGYESLTDTIQIKKEGAFRHILALFYRWTCMPSFLWNINKRQIIIVSGLILQQQYTKISLMYINLVLLLNKIYLCVKLT